MIALLLDAGKKGATALVTKSFSKAMPSSPSKGDFNYHDKMYYSG